MSQSLRVLLIEDNPADVIYLQATLKNAGLKCLLTVIEDGEEAFEAVRDMANSPSYTHPHLIILDINLPKKDGFEILAELRQCKVLENTPVVVLSTSEEPSDRLKATEQNAIYFTKPARLENLFPIFETLKFACQQIADNEIVHGLDSAAKFLSPVSYRILVIEDNPTDAFFLKKTIERSKLGACKLSTADDLKAALTLLKTETFDVILTDLGLSDANGLEVLTQLLAATQHELPIIVLTGHDDERTAEEAVAQGAQDYLVKGEFDERTLSRAIKYGVTRKKAEELALMNMMSEAIVLRELLQNSPISMVKFARDFSITAYNEAFSKVFNLTSQTIIGQSITDIVPVVDPQLWKDSINKAMPFRVEKCVVKPPSTDLEKTLDLTVWPISSNHNNEVKGGILVGLDITSQTALERQKEDFTAALAHDIRNPLIGADRILSIMADSEVKKEDNQKFVAMLRESNSNVLSMLQNLLDIYRYEASAVALVFQRFSIRQPIEMAISQAALLALEKRIAIKISIPENLEFVYADVTALQRVFSNLLHNAIKFSPTDSVIDVVAYCAHDNIVVDIIDAGAGMTKAELSGLFKRFGESRASGYTLGAGTGLGLYLCKQIVVANKGVIDCESTPGVGTKFRVKLPCAPLDIKANVMA